MNLRASDAVEIRKKLINDAYLFHHENKWIFYGKVSGLILVLTEQEATALKHFLNGADAHAADKAVSAVSGLCERTINKIVRRLKNRTAITENIPPVESFVILACERCNMKCTYCYGDYCNVDKNMTAPTMHRILDIAQEQGVRSVGIFGGEPLLNFDIVKDGVEYSRNKGYDIDFSLTTNATLITEDIADYLADRNIRVSVGLDGPQNTHDLTRQYKDGSSTFNDVIRGINILNDRKLLEVIEVTYSMKHPHNIEDMMFFAKDLCPQVSIACVDGKRGAHHYNEEVVRGERLKNFYKRLLDLHFSGEWKDKNVLLGGIDELVHALLSEIKIIRPFICRGIMQRATITANGNLYPCPETLEEEYCFGNVHDEDQVNVFSVQREAVLHKLSRCKIDNYWFSNIADCCIVRIHEDDDGTTFVDDHEAISDTFEYIIYKLVERYPDKF